MELEAKAVRAAHQAREAAVELEVQVELAELVVVVLVVPEELVVVVLGERARASTGKCNCVSREIPRRWALECATREVRFAAMGCLAHVSGKSRLATKYAMAWMTIAIFRSTRAIPEVA